MMTPAEFRRIAMGLPEVTEASHMGHPDFRVGDKIFATLGYPDASFGVVMLSPQDQDFFVRNHPKAFAPVRGSWGKAGATTVTLRAASRRAGTIALETAWQRRAPKRLVNSDSASAPRRRQRKDRHP
ncbi:MAG: MmcQ/YjbR family DNA-binding protein [Gemmatimonadaceae bacterium]